MPITASLAVMDPSADARWLRDFAEFVQWSCLDPIIRSFDHEKELALCEAPLPRR